MENRIQLRHDPDVNALYIRVAIGEVARTEQFDADVFVDFDETGRPLGVEFLNADDFVPFLRRHSGNVDIPYIPFGEQPATQH